MRSEDPLIIKIKKCILNSLPQKSTLKEVSLNLNLSSRTIQRKLYQQNTHFKEIEKDLLIKLAKKLILNENRSTDEISYLLDFSEASSFIRFFKKEMNCTPGNYKNNIE